VFELVSAGALPHSPTLNSPGGRKAIGLFLFLDGMFLDVLKRASFKRWRQDSDCIGRSDTLYDRNGASHDAVEQDFYHRNAGEDYTCADCRFDDESGKPPLRF
jgi:hypothetical protein